MRAHFIEKLRTLAVGQPEILFLTGDLGFGVVEAFARDCPQQFINMGAAEQNMVGVATGLASRGFLPYVYSIINFSVMRPLEFIRNGPIAHGLPVRIVGIGPGFDYGVNGVTHYGVEDIACLRSIGGIEIVVPASVQRSEELLASTLRFPGPVYFRLSKDDSLNVPELSEATEGNGYWTFASEPSADVAVVCLGSAIVDGLRARRLLARQGIESTVFCVERLNEDSLGSLVAQLGSFSRIVTVEAHSIRGGMGSAIAELYVQHGYHGRLRRLGIDTVPKMVGLKATLERACRFDAEGIVSAVQQLSELVGV